MIGRTQNSAIRTERPKKVLKMYQALHPRSNVDKLYLPRSEAGKGLLSL